MHCVIIFYYINFTLILLFYFLLFRDELLTKKLNGPVINFGSYSYNIIINSLRNSVCTCMVLQIKFVVVLLSTTKYAKKIYNLYIYIYICLDLQKRGYRNLSYMRSD